MWNYGLCTTCKVVTSPFHASGECICFYSGNQTSVAAFFLCICMYMLATNHRLPTAGLCRCCQPNSTSLHAPGLASGRLYNQMQAPNLEKRTKHTLINFHPYTVVCYYSAGRDTNHSSMMHYVIIKLTYILVSYICK
jgi:hypothetical protein